MEKIKLCVEEGTKLHDVADIQIPPFKDLPGVIIWGNRTFKNAGTMNGGRWLFTEVFAYTVPEICGSCQGRLD